MSNLGEQLMNWKNFLFWLGIFYIAVTPIVFFLSGNEKELSIFLIISGALLVVLSRFEDVSELGLFGLKAKIDRAVKEAYATIEQVKEFAKISAKASLSNTARSGWWGGIPDDQCGQILETTRATLLQLGCTEQEIEAIEHDFHNCQLSEYKSVLLAGGVRKIPKHNNKNCLPEWEELRGRPVFPPIAPKELKDFFKKYGFMTEENKKRLAGYEYYFNHRKFLDFDDFKNRKNWPRVQTH